MKQKILIVGAGGIGSWLAAQLYELERHGQLNSLIITFADDDTVDSKNLLYQNFGVEDQLDLKVDSLSARYGFLSLSDRIETPTTLDEYDCVISAVDNTKFRKLLFKWAHDNPTKHWMDFRSEGRSLAAFTKSATNTFQKMMETLGKEEVEDGSCQRNWELDDGIIQNGNKVVAAIGSQYILNYTRNQASPAQVILSL
ncbi:MAG: ThiF family adenylyltransferase [Rhodobacteraceae bacterium]|nr:ThiF family adenylyltransferase [Paracoccaceae bacterium]